MTQPLHTISSTANIQVFGTTGATSATPSTGGWSSLSTTKTASFSAIQKAVVQTVTYSPGHTYKAYNPAEEAAQTLYTEQPNGPRRSRGENPGGPAVGDATVPVGTYAINDSQASGSVLACQGVMGNSIYPSFYATLTEYGDLNTLYMLVDGTVGVSQNELGNLHVEVDALNSYERPVHIVYDDDTTPSAVEDVQTEQTTASKQLKNNQLYILRNGEVFNVMGAKVK